MSTSDCDNILESYMRCVKSKKGLSHVDDCPDEADAYKTCIEIEKKAGIGLRQRYNRDSTFFEKLVDNCKEHWGIGNSSNPAHKSYIAPPSKDEDD